MDDKERIQTLCVSELVRLGLLVVAEFAGVIVCYFIPSPAAVLGAGLIQVLLRYVTDPEVWPGMVERFNKMANFVAWLYETFKNRGLEFLRELARKLDSLILSLPPPNHLGGRLALPSSSRSVFLR